MVRPKLNKDQTHWIINGKQYPRLSEVMKVLPNVGLEKWKEKVGYEEAERIGNEAADFGTKIHTITMYRDKKQYNKMYAMLDDDESLLPYSMAWSLYVMKYIKKWIAIEKLVWSEELGVAGTVDRVDEFIDGSICIHDLKTGRLTDEIGIRLAGYKILFNERSKKKKEKVERYMAIQLPRENPGELKVKEYTNPKYEVKFKEACEMYHKMYG